MIDSSSKWKRKGWWLISHPFIQPPSITHMIGVNFAQRGGKFEAGKGEVGRLRRDQNSPPWVSWYLKGEKEGGPQINFIFTPPVRQQKLFSTFITVKVLLILRDTKEYLGSSDKVPWKNCCHPPLAWIWRTRPWIFSLKIPKQKMFYFWKFWNTKKYLKKRRKKKVLTRPQRVVVFQFREG